MRPVQKRGEGGGEKKEDKKERRDARGISLSSLPPTRFMNNFSKASGIAVPCSPAGDREIQRGGVTRETERARG